MHLKDMSKEELELLSYTDLTNLLLKENGNSMSTPDIFREICNLTDISFDENIDRIGDYYTSLTLDKRFVLLDNKWDLRERHAVSLVIDDEDEDENIEEEIEEVEEVDEETENIEEPIEDEDDLDDGDNDIEDLTIISDDDEEDEL